MRELSLRLLSIEGGWFLIQRNAFDMTVRNEPYHALQILYQASSLRYLIRIWGVTRMSGNLDAHPSLAGLCHTVFERTVACVGIIDAADFVRSSKHFVLTAFPFARQIARQCHMSYKLSPKPTSQEARGIGLCRECSLSQFQTGRIDFDEGKLIKDKSGCSDGSSLNADFAEDKEDDPNWPPDGDCEYFEAEEDLGSECKPEGTDADGVMRGVKEEPGEGNQRPNSNHSARGRDLKRPGGGGRNRRGRPRLSLMSPEELGRWRSLKREPEKRECDICHGMYVKEGLLIHKKQRHLLGAFRCSGCDFEGKFPEEITRHITVNHPSNMCAECPICNESVVFCAAAEAREFETHYKACLRRKIREEKAARAARPDWKPYIRRKLICDLCGAQLASSSHLEDHKKLHTGEKPYKCDACDFASVYKKGLEKHKLAHLRKQGITPECDFQCPVCGKFFSTNNYLHKHIARIHEGYSENVKCESCDLVFPHKYAMKRHMNRKHQADPRFRCESCGKFCEDSRSLREHMNMHGDPQYFCKFCGKALRSMKSLKNHERIHTGENPYKCEFCEYYCKSSTTLSLHRKFKHAKKPPIEGSTQSAPSQVSSTIGF